MSIRTISLGEIRGQLVAIADDIDEVVPGTTGEDTLDGGNGNDAILVARFNQFERI